MNKELLQQALDALELQPRVLTIDNNAYPHTVARDEVIHKLKQALAQQAHFEEQPDGTVIPVDPSEKAQQEQPASVDAYNGAREDVAIWKKRALEAEELNRKFIAELNGPTYLGEPVKQEQPAQEPVAWMHKTGSVWNGINRPDERGYWKPLYTHPAPTQPAQEPFKWYDGAPPFPQNQESFIAQTIYGERVVLRVLPEEYAYDYTTADSTYMKAENIEKWMQFPDCQFLPPEPAPTQPALKDDVGVACLETMVKTMTNLGIATDSSLEGFGARLETHIYAMCRAVDGIFKARPALSDMECRYLVEQALTDYANLTWTPRRHLDTDLNSNPALVVIIAKVIEAHCRGGAK